MKKKLLSLVMAIAMTLSLAAPAFAANTALFYERETDADKRASTDQSVSFTALTFVPTISLAMPIPPTNPVVLNPYKISFSGASKIGTMNVNAADATAQVICPVYTIENKSNTVLTYDVSATTTVADTITLKDDAVELDATSKEGHFVLVFSKTEQSATEIAGYGQNTSPQMLFSEDIPAGKALDRFDESKYETITLKSGEVKCDDSIERTLAAAELSGNNYVANYLPFQFQGDMTRKPASAWTANDTFACVVKFTFNPDSAQDFIWNGGATGSETLFVDSNNTINATDISVANIEYTLPDKSGTTAISDTNAGPWQGWNGNANAAANTTGYKYLIGGTAQAGVPTFSTEDPGWSVISGGQAFGADISTGTNGISKLVFDKESLKELKKGSTHTAKIVLGYIDKNEIPRTMSVKVQLTRLS